MFSWFYGDCEGLNERQLSHVSAQPPVQRGGFCVSPEVMRSMFCLSCYPVCVLHALQRSCKSSPWQRNTSETRCHWCTLWFVMSFETLTACGSLGYLRLVSKSGAVCERKRPGMKGWGEALVDLGSFVSWVTFEHQSVVWFTERPDCLRITGRPSAWAYHGANEDHTPRAVVFINLFALVYLFSHLL